MPILEGLRDRMRRRVTERGIVTDEPTPVPEAVPTAPEPPPVVSTPEPVKAPKPEATPAPGPSIEQRGTLGLARFREVEARLQPKLPFEPDIWMPSSQEDFQTQVSNTANLFESSGGVTRLGEEDPVTVGIVPQLGDTDDVMTAYAYITWVHKNLDHILPQAEQYDPANYRNLEDSKAGLTVNTATLNPTKALIDAVNSIAEENPHNYTSFLASEEGASELLSRSVLMMLSPPYFREASLLAPGEAASEVVQEFLPEHPMRNVLTTFLEMAGDPLFIATIPVFGVGPGLYTKIAGGMAVGEVAAEEMGAPPFAGALLGGLFGPTVFGALRGITNAGIREALLRARINPRPGTTAHELLKIENQVVRDLEEIEIASGRELVRHGSTDVNWRAIEREGGIPRPSVATTGRMPGIYVSEDEAIAQRMAESTAVLGGGEPEVRALRLAEGARVATEAQVEEIAFNAGIRGNTAKEMEKLAKLVVAEGFDAATHLGNKVILNAKVLQPIAMAGGAEGASLGLMERLIRVAIERPEARDLLRKAAVMLDRIPGMRDVVKLLNRMAIVETPWEKAAIGRELVRVWQDAQREMSLAPFRGRRVPFHQNNKAQIWLPAKAGGKKPVFGMGDGTWEAVGDVFEDVLRGGKAFTARLTSEQVEYINELSRAMAPFTAEAEAATRVRIATRKVHWPRFSIDPHAEGYQVRSGTGGGKPSALFERHIEVQQEAIEELGIRYRPGILQQADLYIAGMQRLSRDAILGQYLRREGLLKLGGRQTIHEAFASDLGQAVPAWTREGNVLPERINKEHLREMQAIGGPGFGRSAPEQILVHIPRKVNSVFRLILTGTVDTGWGAIQLMTLPFVPGKFGQGAHLWAEAMARGFYNMIVDPKAYYRFLANSPAAKRYALFGGNVGVDSEFFEATKLLGPGGSRTLNVATFPIRAFVGRLQVGFESTLGIGRVLAFDAMADAAASGGPLRFGARAPLAGEALMDEMYRIARFTDTLLGQPKLGGIVSLKQQQVESAWVWFAARYTRSFLGTMSYIAGSGYTPAQARVILAKMFLGGAAIMSGLQYALGKSQGLSDEEIISNITTMLNPQSGKKYMSIEVGGDWYGLGGVYRSGFALFGSLTDKENWTFEEWEDPIWDNPVVRGWRSRTAPDTSSIADWWEGETYLGYEVPRDFFISDPAKLMNYLGDRWLPIAIGAYMQNPRSWRDPRRVAAGFAEFFGLRTSPESAGEALQAIQDIVSQDRFGVPFDDLKYNTAARAWVRETPQVQMVIEGRVLPIDEKRVQDEWDRFREEQNEIRAKYYAEKEALDECFESLRCGGRSYRDDAGDIQAREFHELQGMRLALDIEFDPKEAPEGTVDYALEQRFAVDIKDYTDPDSLEVDWEAFLAARDAPISALSPEDQELVEWYLGRHKTPRRREVQKAFDEIIVPSGYLDRREAAADSIDIDLDALQAQVTDSLLAAGKRAAPGDVLRIVDDILNGERKRILGPDAPTIAEMRRGLRLADPRLDVELYRQGYVFSVLSEEALAVAAQLVEQYPDRGYSIPTLAAGAETNRP